MPAALEAWCRGLGINDAALYARSPEGWWRACQRGGASFPRRLATPRQGAFEALELADGLLLYAAGTTPVEADAPDVRLLAASLRIHRLEAELKHQSFQAQYRGVELEALYDVGLVIASTLDLAKLSEDVLLRAVSLLDARRGGFYELVDERFLLRSSIGGDAAPALDAADPGLGELLERSSTEDLAEPTALGILPGCSSTIAVAIDSDGRRRGLLALGDKESRRGVGPFSGLDRRTLSLFAHQAAIALENAHLHQQALEKERMERDMELAAEIQQQILPKLLPRVPGYEVFGWNRPARQVGGDYFDVRRLADGRLVLVVADVSGKGVPASLMVSTLHSALRLSLDRGPGPGRIGPALLAGINRHLLDLSLPNKFITLFIAELEPASGRLRFLNAGHNPAFLVRCRGGAETLVASGPPLGLLPEAEYRVQGLELEPGDLLCLYTDGVTECTSPREEEFGPQRLLETLTAGRTLPLEDLVDRIDDLCAKFAEGQPQGDDQTMALLRRSEPARADG